MKSRWLAKIAAIVCAICLAMGVMSQTVFARDNASAAGKYAPEEPMATFIVLGAEEQSATPVPEITDNRTVLPMYADGVQVGQCAIVNGQPYMGVAAFCQGLGLGAQTQDNGNAVSLAMNGVMLLAQAGQAYLACNERYIYLDNGVQLLDGAVALPVEQLVKCIGLTAYWDRVQWTLTVDKSAGAPLEPGSTFYDESDLYWLSRLIFSMASTEPLEAKVAVGEVCVNRLHSGAFGGQKNIYEVVFAKNQFDVVTNGMIYVEPDESSVMAAKMALEGTDLAKGASYVSAQELSGDYTCVAQLGDLMFYTAA